MGTICDCIKESYKTIFGEELEIFYNDISYSEIVFDKEMETETGNRNGIK